MDSKDMYEYQRRMVRYWRYVARHWVDSMFTEAEFGLDTGVCKTQMAKCQRNYEKSFECLMVMHSNPTKDGIFGAFTNPEYNPI